MGKECAGWEKSSSRFKKKALKNRPISKIEFSDSSSEFSDASFSGLVPFEATLPGDALDDHELESASSDWDIAVRYAELKAKARSHTQQKRLIDLSVRAILGRAQGILGSMVHSKVSGIAPFGQLPANAEGPEFDLDSTLENSHPAQREVWMKFTSHRPEPLVLCVDTSLSMTGEKLALTAVAIAVVLLQFKDDPIGVVTFETEPHIIKRPDEMVSPYQVIERFLDSPGRGYTDMEEGLLAALKQVSSIPRAQTSKPASSILITDGKYTAGKEPSYLGGRFPNLQVIKMGDDHSSAPLCRALARSGGGSFREVSDFQELPGALFTVVRDLIRSRNY